MTTSDGVPLSYAYDSYCQPTKVVDGLSAQNTETATYQEVSGGSCGALRGQLCSVTDFDGGTTSYGYDSTGDVTSLTYDPAGNGASSTFGDIVGSVVRSFIGAVGVVPGALGLGDLASEDLADFVAGGLAFGPIALAGTAGVLAGYEIAENT